MIVLDASGSMLADDVDGKVRMDVAKDATADVIRDVGRTSALGLETYGTETGSSDAEREAGCKDITVLDPPGPNRGDDLVGKVRALTPRGYTPIGESLRRAAGELTGDGPKTVVLVSDGIETCTPPPACDVARELRGRGIDLVVNTVGFKVDDAARAELGCIASATGGRYADAGDQKQLTAAMTAAADRTYRAHATTAPELTGADDPGGATPVPADVTTFRTTLGGGKDEDSGHDQNWSVPIAPGERVVASVQSVLPPRVANYRAGRAQMHVRFSTPAEPWSPGRSTPDCTHQNDDLGEAVQNGVARASAVSATDSEGCRTDRLLLGVNRFGEWMADRDVPVEITVTRFGPADVAGVPEPAREVDEPAPLAPGADPQQVRPGTWVDDAAAIPADGTHAVTADIVPGETQWFRVDAGWGQRLATTTVVTRNAMDAARVDPGDQLNVSFVNRARQQLAGPARVPVVENQFGKPVTAGTGVPINYRNMVGEGSPDSDARMLWLDGVQYVAVNYERLFTEQEIDAGTELPPVTYTLTARVDGRVQPGPRFTAVAQPSGAGATPVEDAPESDPGDGLSAVWIGSGVAVVIALGVLGWLLFGRRRR